VVRFATRPVLGHTLPSIYLLPGTISSEVKRLGSEATH
jgi:hypothetical protein